MNFLTVFGFIVVYGLGILTIPAQVQSAATASGVSPTTATDPGVAALNNDGFETADASSITIAFTKSIPNASSVPPAFSPDGKLFIYGEISARDQNNQVSQVRLIVKDFASLSTIKTITPEHLPFRLAFSPDSSMIVYTDRDAGKSMIHVIKTDGTEVALPYRDQILNTDNITWMDQNTIAFYSLNNGIIWYLNLDTLQLTDAKVMFGGIDYDNRAAKEYARIFATNLPRPNVRMFRRPTVLQVIAVWADALFVSNSDNSHSHSLLNNIQGPSFFAPNLRHVVNYDPQSNSITVLYMGVRAQPKQRFRINLNAPTGLTADDKNKFAQHFANNYVGGKIYAAQINPLNNKLIGADMQTEKGAVRIIELHDDYAIVDTVTELQEFKAGDILTGIWEGDTIGNGISYSGWYQLEDDDSAPTSTPNASSSDQSGNSDSASTLTQTDIDAIAAKLISPFANERIAPKDFTQEWAKYQTAADHGDADAQYHVGRFYYRGWGVPRDFVQALSWMRKSADQDNALAQFNLGVLFKTGEGVVKDDAQAQVLIKQAIPGIQKAASEGNDDAQNKLGLAYEDGLGLTKDVNQALTCFQESADQGNSDAEFSLGRVYSNGWGVAKDYVQALAWYQKAAAQDNLAALVALGRMYLNGWGVAKDEGHALSWYENAAEQGSAEAQVAIGSMFANGQGVVKNYGQARIWYQKAADQGNADAQFNIGNMYEMGWGVAKDYSQARIWYQKAADQGSAKAETNIGLMYANGWGTTKDYGQALIWYQKAADQGYSGGQYLVGSMYANGWGVAKDMSQSFSWCQKAANQGYSDAELTMGKMYARGLGVAEDNDQANQWFQKAAASGNNAAGAEIQKLEKASQVDAQNSRQFDGTWTGPTTSQVSRWGISLNQASSASVMISNSGKIVSFPGNKNLPAINNVNINGNTLSFTNTFKSNNGKTTTTFIGVIQVIDNSSVSYSMHTTNVPGGESDIAGTLTRQ